MADNVRYNPRAKMVYVAHAVKSLGVIDAKTDVKATLDALIDDQVPLPTN